MTLPRIQGPTPGTPTLAGGLAPPLDPTGRVAPDQVALTSAPGASSPTQADVAARARAAMDQVQQQATAEADAIQRESDQAKAGNAVARGFNKVVNFFDHDEDHMDGARNAALQELRTQLPHDLAEFHARVEAAGTDPAKLQAAQKFLQGALAHAAQVTQAFEKQRTGFLGTNKFWSGLAADVGAGLLVLGGAALCATGLGAPVGVAMIAGGVVAGGAATVGAHALLDNHYDFHHEALGNFLTGGISTGAMIATGGMSLGATSVGGMAARQAVVMGGVGAATSGASSFAQEAQGGFEGGWEGRVALATAEGGAVGAVAGAAVPGVAGALHVPLGAENAILNRGIQVGVGVTSGAAAGGGGALLNEATTGFQDGWQGRVIQQAEGGAVAGGAYGFAPGVHGRPPAGPDEGTASGGARPAVRTEPAAHEIQFPAVPRGLPLSDDPIVRGVQLNQQAFDDWRNGASAEGVAKLGDALDHLRGVDTPQARKLVANLRANLNAIRGPIPVEVASGTPLADLAARGIARPPQDVHALHSIVQARQVTANEVVPTAETHGFTRDGQLDPAVGETAKVRDGGNDYVLTGRRWGERWINKATKFDPENGVYRRLAPDEVAQHALQAPTDGNAWYIRKDAEPATVAELDRPIALKTDWGEMAGQPGDLVVSKAGDTYIVQGPIARDTFAGLQLVHPPDDIAGSTRAYLRTNDEERYIAALQQIRREQPLVLQPYTNDYVLRALVAQTKDAELAQRLQDGTSRWAHDPEDAAGVAAYRAALQDLVTRYPHALMTPTLVQNGESRGIELDEPPGALRPGPTGSNEGQGAKAPAQAPPVDVQAREGAVFDHLRDLRSVTLASGHTASTVLAPGVDGVSPQVTDVLQAVLHSRYGSVGVANMEHLESVTGQVLDRQAVRQARGQAGPLSQHDLDLEVFTTFMTDAQFKGLLPGEVADAPTAYTNYGDRGAAIEAGLKGHAHRVASRYLAVGGRLTSPEVVKLASRWIDEGSIPPTRKAVEDLAREQRFSPAMREQLVAAWQKALVATGQANVLAGYNRGTWLHGIPDFPSVASAAREAGFSPAETQGIYEAVLGHHMAGYVANGFSQGDLHPDFRRMAAEGQISTEVAPQLQALYDSSIALAGKWRPVIDRQTAKGQPLSPADRAAYYADAAPVREAIDALPEPVRDQLLADDAGQFATGPAMGKWFGMMQGIARPKTNADLIRTVFRGPVQGYYEEAIARAPAASRDFELATSPMASRFGAVKVPGDGFVPLQPGDPRYAAWADSFAALLRADPEVGPKVPAGASPEDAVAWFLAQPADPAALSRIAAQGPRK